MKQRKLSLEIDMLGAKKISLRDSFVLHGESDCYFTVSQTGAILDLDGNRVFFTENEIWENFERIEKIPRAQFERELEAHREHLWKERGQPGRDELAQLTEQFLSDYVGAPEGKGWHWVCAYDEETLLRLAEQAAERLESESPVRRRECFRKIYRDMVVAKAMRGKGRTLQ